MKARRTTRQIVRGTAMYRGTAVLDPGPEPRARAPKPKPKTPASRRGQALVALVLALALIGLAAGAWFGRHALGHGFAALELGRARVTVSGNEYLSPDEVRRASGLDERVSFFRVDLDKARDRLLQNRRVLEARLSRRLNGEVRLDITERVPAALALYGKPVEVAADGTVLPPLVSGVLPDLPIVTGLAAPQKNKIADADWPRAVRWVHRLDDPALALEGRVSEIDVSGGDLTTVVLAPHGARLLLPAEAREADGLGGVRVVLADLQARGVEAATIDCRARGLVVVEPVPGSSATDGKNAKPGASVTAALPHATQTVPENSAPSGTERRRG